MSVEASGERIDVAVIGAGPAGMAAASVCARAGLDTVLIDEQPGPGGQAYRGVTSRGDPNPARRGRDYLRGAGLARDFVASGTAHLTGTAVWSLDRQLEMGLLAGGRARLLSARRVILATGAIERPFPFEGWTLPGVMSAGAGQILFKSSGIVPAGRVVLAGCGPLIWLLASQYLAAGVRIDAILDTTPRANWRRAWPHFLSFLGSDYVAKGIALLASGLARVRVIAGVDALRAEGNGKVERVTYRQGDRLEATLAVDTLLVHQGVVPNVNLAMAAGVEHRWSETLCAWVPVLGLDGRSSVDGLFIAGDGGGIVGALAAEAQGRLSGMAAASELGVCLPTGELQRARDALRRRLRGRDFLDALFLPAPSHRAASGNTIVCRCEEVTARTMTEAVEMGCAGPNQLKAFLRCGMGPCQGRQCGLAVTELIASARGVAPAEVGYYRMRVPVKPVPVQALAALPTTEAAIRAADR